MTSDDLRGTSVDSGKEYICDYGPECNASLPDNGRWRPIGMQQVNIREVSILCEDAQQIIGQLDRELSDEYAPEDMHVVDFEPFHRDGGVFVIAYDSARPAGCGALRPLSADEVELKRMYVTPDYRGRGVARRILAYLETAAQSRGYERLLLETGDQQTAAIRLYRSSGYEAIEPFGEYVGGSRSVCFGKTLRDNSPSS